MSTYNGSLRSCSGKIDVLGEKAVQQFIIDPAQPHLLGKTNLVEANQKATNVILLGRDIMSRVPKLREAMDRKRDVVHKMTTESIKEIERSTEEDDIIGPSRKMTVL